MHRTILLGLGLLTLAAAPLAAHAEEPVGHVTNLAGRAVAERPGEAPRELRCRDAVYPGERVVTAKDSRVGLVMGELFAQLDASSALQLNGAPGAPARLALESGAVRVIDPREAGAPAELAVLDTRARVVGNDAEGYVFAEKTGGYAMLCEWDAPLSVARGGEQKSAGAGECVVAKRSEPLYVAAAHPERLGSPGRDACALGPVAGGPELHLLPSQVAAGPPAPPWSGPGGPTTFPERSPCDQPGSGCLTGVEPGAIPTSRPGAGSFPRPGGGG